MLSLVHEASHDLVFVIIKVELLQIDPLLFAPSDQRRRTVAVHRVIQPICAKCYIFIDIIKIF